jgi:hypothetical protein
MFNTYNVSGVIFSALFRRLVVIKRKVNTYFMQRINEMEQILGIAVCSACSVCPL